MYLFATIDGCFPHPVRVVGHCPGCPIRSQGQPNLALIILAAAADAFTEDPGNVINALCRTSCGIPGGTKPQGVAARPETGRLGGRSMSGGDPSQGAPTSAHPE